MATEVKEESCSSNFGLSNDSTKKFVSAQWSGFSQGAYLLWQWIAATYFTIWIILSGEWYRIRPGGIKWFINLTNWTYLLFVLDLISRAVITLVYYSTITSHARKSPYEGKPLPWFVRVEWVVYNISTCLTFVVCMLYWALLYTPGETVLDASVVHAHGVNAAFLLCDFFISAHPARFAHFFHSVLFGIVYALFTVVYTVFGGTNIFQAPYVYHVLNWSEDPYNSTAYAAGIVLGVVPVTWIVICVIHRIRVAIFDCLDKDRKKNGDII